MVLIPKPQQDKVKLFKTILIDVPWPEKGGGKIKRGADKHYDVLKLKDVVSTIKGSGLFNPDPNGCHLYFWVTNNYLTKGLKIVEELGFRYITLITWPKKRFGLGRYFRGQTEHLIFAVMGKAMMPDYKKESTLLIEEDDYKREHSSKPKSSYAKIEKVSPGPYLEMFARGRRHNKKWKVWGHQAITGKETIV